MSWLFDVKQELADALTGYRALPYAGSQISTPTAWVENGDPVLSRGEVFGEWRIDLQVTAFPVTGSDNKVKSKGLDIATCELIELIETETNFTVTGVTTGAFDDPNSNNTFSAISLSVTTYFTKD